MTGIQTQRRCCAKCRGIFFTRVRTQIYCTRDCSKSAQNARRYQRKKAEK